eukprot:10381213-Alexandrium_andersonii.AAC.1
MAHPVACGDALLGVHKVAQHRVLACLRLLRREFRAPRRGGIRHGRRQCNRRAHSRAAGAA